MYMLKPSFAAGELSPAMYGRTDIAKYDVGAAKLENFIVLRYGGVQNRAGTKYLATTAGNKKAVLLPFRYNVEQNFIIEITAGKIRFYTQGALVTKDGAPYEITNNYSEDELDTIKYTQSADVMFLVQPNHPPATLTRYANDNWTFERMDITGGPFAESSYSGRIAKTVTFGTPGSHTFKVPSNVTSLQIELAGGGGGGGGAYTGGSKRNGGAGGTGGLLKRNISVTAGQTYSITVGAGGTGRENQNKSAYKPPDATAGGNTTFGSYTVTGGAGGTSGGYYNAGAHSGVNGANGTPTGAGGTGGTAGTPSNGGGTDGGDGWCIITYNVDSGSDTTVQASDVSGDITLTANKEIFNQNDVGTLFELSHFVGSTYKKGVPNSSGSNLTVEVLPHSSVHVESFGFWDGNFTLEKYDNISNKWVTVRSQNGNRSSNYNFTEENDSDSIVSYRVTSTEFNTDVWSGENEQQRGFITIQSFGNDYSGYVLITQYISATQVKATVKKRLASTAATKDFSFASWTAASGYPSCAGFFEDRLVFAGSKTEPQTFWTSKTGDYYNFGTSIPALDNDAVTATLNGGQMNGIKAIIAFGEMILLTAGGEYKVTGNGKPITGENVLSQAQEYRGISDVLPVTVGSRIVYLQQQGSIIRDLAYSYDVDKYTGDDLNLLASHLFERHKITSMTYQQTPNSIVWCTRDDGVLLGLTYLKEQDVYAWHQHSTAHGKFINVCAISGPQEDELYCVVEREGNYYVERMVAREASAEPEDQYFVDSGITVSGNTKTNEVTGLDHLEGLEVAILADGNVQPLQTVTDGKITLKRAYSKIHVGLPIHAEMQTLPLEFNVEDGTFMSRKKRVSALMAMFKDSRGGLYGIGDGPKNEFKWRSTEKWGEPIALFTGKKKMPVPQANWNETVMVTISQEDPLPLTILSLVPQIEAGG